MWLLPDGALTGGYGLTLANAESFSLDGEQCQFHPQLCRTNSLSVHIPRFTAPLTTVQSLCQREQSHKAQQSDHSEDSLSSFARSRDGASLLGSEENRSRLRLKYDAGPIT
jgi:hypothetical protein